jgi:choline dehydrogenase-like flavoprotein
MKQLRPVRYSTRDEVDFVVIGSGAAGGVIAKELSTAGFRVVVLEQGPRLQSSDFKHDELPDGVALRIPSDVPEIGRRGNAIGDRLPVAAVRAPRGWEQCPLHGQLLALPPGRLRGAEPPRADRRDGVRRLAPHLPGARALLHESRVGGSAFPGRRGPSIHRARARTPSRRCR